MQREKPVHHKFQARDGVNESYGLYSIAHVGRKIHWQ